MLYPSIKTSEKVEWGSGLSSRIFLTVMRRCWQMMFLVLMMIITAVSTQAASPLKLTLSHCPIDVTVTHKDALARCNLDNRPTARSQQLSNDRQLMRLTIHNADHNPQPAHITIGPYYLAWVELLRPRTQMAVYEPTEISTPATQAEYPPLPPIEESELGLIGRGGAFSKDPRTATLGGHIFAVTLQPGANDFLLRLQAPGFSHVFVEAAAANFVAPDVRIIGISVHLGMLTTLAGLALIGLLLRPNTINSRLLLFNSIILIQVSLGSGFIPILIPEVAGHGAMTAFMALIVLRIAAWGWLYQALIEPHLTKGLYRRVCWLTYLLCVLAMGLFLFEKLVAARAITFALIFGIPLVHTIAALRARTLIPLTKHALLGSLILYNVLQAIAILLMMLETGQSNLPVWISRAMDLLIPLLAMGTVLLRNRASDQQLAVAEQALARNAAALEAETEMRKEKRTLIDMLTHEVRNPLATIKLATRSLQGQLPADSEPVQRRLANINAAIGTIDEVIERCDLHNSMEAAGIAPTLQRVALPALLTSIAERLGQPERFRLSGQSPATIETDPQLLEILLTNLMDNALKYSPSDTPIWVETFALPADDGGMTWGVRITNAVTPGMTPDPERLFERYYRHEHSRRQGGSGLGLSLCRNIAEILGGHLQYQPDKEQVTFEFSKEATH